MSRVVEGEEGEEDEEEQYYSDTFDDDEENEEGEGQHPHQHQHGKKRHAHQSSDSQAKEEESAIQASALPPPAMDLSAYDYVLDASDIYRRQLHNVKMQLARLKLGMEERGSTGLGQTYTSLAGLQHLRGRRVEIEQK